ncbi:hypothetical protein FJT64_004966 [Amphibalanus amphitrite]|uniref:Uncharacterized protein n=1 Tax=Amphibalanus amphitrite TaxID=1232801 RepID=A0A6A4VS94_AMPAM|nr:hypothetical protein FJT64_004966 [Amphibalanus amphitrite]
MRAHSIREITNSSAEFLVSVGGQFRPRAACRPPGFESKRRGRRRSARLFDGEPTFIEGIDLPSWNVSISATERADRLEVRVLRQMDGSGSGSYFPELFVTLYRPPDEARWPPRRLARRRVPFTPADGSTVQFSSSLPGHKVDVRPAGSWVCQGANDGCQKRYAPVDELLELTERARADRGIEA